MNRRFTPLLTLALLPTLLAWAGSAPLYRLNPVPALKVSVASIADIRKMIDSVEEANIERTVRKLVSFGTRNTLSDQTSATRGIGAARDWLFSEFKSIAEASGGRLKVTLQSFEQPVATRIPRPTRITNVIASLQGTEERNPQSYIVISGHYDSMASSPTDATSDAPGANDDASGVAAVLELARVMSKYEFKSTILFAAVAGEEQGLLGSAYLADQIKSGKHIVKGMFTNDIIGGTLGANGVRDRGTVRLFSEGIPSDESAAEALQRKSVGGENDGPSRQLARFIREAATKHVRGIKVQLIARRDRYGRGGDHISFNERGFPAVRFTEPNEDYTHQHQNVREENGVKYGDLPDHVDFGYVAKVARVNLAAAASLALAPAAPGALRFRGGLSPDAELQWTPSTSPEVAGYEIVWRDTMAPDWTNSRLIGNVMNYTMKGMSKDNFLFGVRTVDKQGNRSPVVYPRSGR